jgi:cytochrome c-type biogenesis protein CcmH/NrfG
MTAPHTFRSPSAPIAVLAAVLALAAATGCSRNPEAASAKLLELGKQELQEGQHARALIRFRSAARLTPKKAEPQYQVALAYLTAGNARGALQALRTALSIEAEHRGAKAKLAEMLAASGHPDLVTQGAAKAREVLAKTPGDADALNAMASAPWPVRLPMSGRQRGSSD